MKEGYVHDQPITDGDSENQIVENIDNTDDDFDAYVESEVTERPKTSTSTSTTTKKPSAPTVSETYICIQVLSIKKWFGSILQFS